MVRLIPGPTSAQGQDILGRTTGAKIESGLETISALPSVLPIGHGRTGYGPGASIAIRIDKILPRLGSTRGALLGALVFSEAPSLDDFSSTPTGGEVVLSGLRAAPTAIRSDGDLKEWPIFLRIAMARVDLDNALPFRVVLGGRQLFVPR